MSIAKNQVTPAPTVMQSTTQPTWVRARRDRFGSLAILLALLFFVAACDESGGGEGGGVRAVGVIDLPPGQTHAQLAWEASQGDVASYMLFEARNGQEFEYLGTVPEARTEVTGRAGDSVQVMVLALNESGLASNPSEPSALLRFHAANPAALQSVDAETTPPPSLVDASPSAASPSTASPSTASPSTASAAEPEAAPGIVPSSSEVVVASRSAETSGSTEAADAGGIEREVPDDQAADETLDEALRELLLRADVRLSTAPLSDAVQHWLEARVEAQFEAGVRLIGSGDADRDGLSELVWQDSAGQLFVSGGAEVDALALVSAVPDTFADAPRLAATERYAGLADFDADGAADWLIEDTATGEPWLVDGRTGESRSARSLFESEDLALVGHGDFDGDGRHELLWQSPDQALHLGHPEASTPPLASGLPSLEPGRLLGVADLDGDGRDDLLLRGEYGGLVRILSQAQEGQAQEDGNVLGFRLEAGIPSPGTADQLDFVATLDLDADGAVEIAWLADGVLEIWDLGTGEVLDLEP